MSQITDELLSIDRKYGKDEIISFIFKSILIVSFVIIAGIYTGEMLFGDSSLEVLLSLKSDKNRLEYRIYKLKKENASLQKEYFELNSLMPDEEKN